MLAKTEGKEEQGTTEDKLLDGISDLMDMSVSKFQELVMDQDACVLQSHMATKSRT